MKKSELYEKQKQEILNRIYEVTPDFKIILESEYDEEERALLYIVAGRWASYLLDLFKSNKVGNFDRISHFIEHLHLDRNHSIREFATVGILEGIQNVWGNNGVDPENFSSYLLPESRKWWKELDRFWSGEVKYLGQSFKKENK